MPQFDYTHPALLLGQIATTNPWTINSYLNALLAQESVVTSAAAPAAGDYTIRIVGEEGTFDVTYTSPGGEAPADIVAGLLAAIDADPDLVNIVVGTDASPDLNLDFIHPGHVYNVSFPSNPGGNLLGATFQAAGGTALTLGTCVVPASPPDESTGAQHVSAPNAATTGNDLLGITVRAVVDVQVNTGVQTDEDAFLPGTTVSVMEEGECVVEVEAAVAFNGPVFVRIGNVGPGQKLGGFTVGPAVASEVIQMAGARYRSATSGNGLAKVAINRPA